MSGLTILSAGPVKRVTPRRFQDDRGFFSETYNERAWIAAGFGDRFVQDNHSLSRRVGTVRGLHFQTPPSAQAKLIRVTRGRIFDAAVDVRRDSPTFGRWVGAELDAETGAQLYVPVGFAHAFQTLEPDTEVVYKVTGFYDAACDGGVFWNDPDVGIAWPLPAEGAVLSAKDVGLPLLKDFDSPFIYDGDPLVAPEGGVLK